MAYVYKEKLDKKPSSVDDILRTGTGSWCCVIAPQDASQEELGQWAADADALTIQIEEKRKKYEEAASAKRRKP